MAQIVKQFSTFRLLLISVDDHLTQENFNKYHIEVDGPGGFTTIHRHEVTYDLMVQLTSSDEAQVRDALDTILIHREFLARELRSILDNKLESSQE